jgi:hypothetical protein
MKKFVFVLMVAATTLFAVSPLFAEGAQFGIKAGLNIANVTGDDAEGFSSKVGLVAGGFMCYNFTEIFAFQPELLFTMKGASGDGDHKWSVNYIEIPVLFKANLPTEGKIKPMLYAGPGFGILMSSKADDVDMKDETTSFDIGVMAGAGIAYQMEKGAITLEARYEVGMTTLAKNEDEDTGSKPDIKNSVISFLVGYAF